MGVGTFMLNDQSLQVVVKKRKWGLLSGQCLEVTYLNSVMLMENDGELVLFLIQLVSMVIHKRPVVYAPALLSIFSFLTKLDERGGRQP